VLTGGLPTPVAADLASRTRRCEGPLRSELAAPQTRSGKYYVDRSVPVVLDRLRVLDTDALMSLLTQIAEPPVKRLEAIVGRLEETHTVTAETVAGLKAIIAMMSDTGIGVDRATVECLAYAAELLNPSDLKSSRRRTQPRRGGAARRRGPR
jgi:hypothetical protein